MWCSFSPRHYYRLSTCLNVNVPPTQFGIFKINYDVDFREALAGPTNPNKSPYNNLANASLALTAERTALWLTTDVLCPDSSLASKLDVVMPISREIIGRSRLKALEDPALLVTLDILGNSAQNGEYLIPVGVGHPEFGESDIGTLSTPHILAGSPWNMDRRLGPGGCDGPCEGTPQHLDPFPFSNLHPCTQADFVDPLGKPFSPPIVTITAPANGSGFTPGHLINFAGTAIYVQDGDLTASLAWTSSLDGAIDTGGAWGLTPSPQRLPTPAVSPLATQSRLRPTRHRR